MSRFTFCLCRTSNRKRMEVKDDFAQRSLPCFSVGGTDCIKHQTKRRKAILFSRRSKTHLGFFQFLEKPIGRFYPLLFLFTPSFPQKQKLWPAVKVTHVMMSEACTPFLWYFGLFLLSPRQPFSRGHSICDVETLGSCRAAGSLRHIANL